MLRSGSTDTLMGLFIASFAKSLTPLLSVALKSKVCLLGFMNLIISLISASNPSSSSLSAYVDKITSSKMSMSTSSKSIAWVFLTRSINLPGVQIKISGRFLNCTICLRTSTCPMIICTLALTKVFTEHTTS